MNRETCPECGDDNTEFVQFATGNESTVKTSPEDVGSGILELRECGDCKIGIENVLTAEKQTTIGNAE